ncbi:aldo/keto reductase [Jatrophihabitans sp. DSM 45814]
MEQRTIGKLAVSVVGLGCNQLGTQYCDEATSARIVSEALDAGVTYFDTADEYGENYFDSTDPDGWGRCEEYLGRALGARRGEVIIGSKFGARPHYDQTLGGGSAKWARQALEDSLRRLGTDYIDLYQLHFPDPDVPIEETLGVMNEFVAAGKVREIGCSNLTGAALEEAATAAADNDLLPFASIEGPLNLLQRGNLDEVLPTADRLGMAYIPYYPLASGVLTGKYRRGEAFPEASRMADKVPDGMGAKILSDRAFNRIEALEAFATERGHTLIELAFGWLLGQPAVASVIAGASKPGQVTVNVGAAGWQLSPQEVALATQVVVDAGN